MARRVREREEVLNNIFDIEQYVIGLYDRIAELENQLKESGRREQSMIDQVAKLLQKNKNNTIYKMAVEHGMECFNQNSKVGDKSFEEWKKDAIHEWKIPDCISKEELYALCDDELRTAYDNKVQEETKNNDDNE